MEQMIAQAAGQWIFTFIGVTMSEEEKLVKKFYVSRKNWYSSQIDFSIVYGTVGKKEFMARKHEHIVGNNSDVRIAVDSPSLFDDFHAAANCFIERNAKSREQVVEDLQELDNATKLVKELVESVPTA